MPQLRSTENALYDVVKESIVAMNALIKRVDELQDAAEAADHHALNAQLTGDLNLLSAVDDYDESSFEELVDASIDIPVVFKFYESKNHEDHLTCKNRTENIVFALEACIAVLNKLAPKEEYSEMDVDGYVKMIQRIMDAADACNFPPRMI